MKTNISKTKTGNRILDIRYSLFDIRNSLFLFIVIACAISFLPVSNTFGQQTATFAYSDTYGGLTGYQTPKGVQVDITRNGFGRHPVELNYNNEGDCLQLPGQRCRTVA